MAAWPAGTRQRIMVVAGLWAGSLVLAPLILVVGLLLHSSLVARLGLLIATVGLTTAW